MNISRRFLSFGIAITLIVALTNFIPPSASAIENGTDATGSSFVVPIKTSEGNFCSGALISAWIVATAGHCVLDPDGLVNNKIYVGEPGSSADSVSANDIVSSIHITPTFSAKGRGASVNDIVFLVLSKAKKFNNIVRLASQTEISALKTSSARLRIYGYGVTTDAGTSTKFPYSLDGVFSNGTDLRFPDEGTIMSLSGNLCKGDSGGPVLNISATQILVVGVLVTTALKNNCGGNSGSFTLISSYANLAFTSAMTKVNSQSEEVIATQQELERVTDWNEGLQTQVGTLEGEKEELQTQLVDLTSAIENLNLQIKALEARIPSTITCVKVKLVKKVTAVNPKCPSGYKKQ